MPNSIKGLAIRVKTSSFFTFVAAYVLFIYFSYGSSKGVEQSQSNSSEPLQNEEKMLQVGEELEYTVHYSFFNIGTIRFKVTDKEERKGRTIYHTYAFMDSNPSLSGLVDLHVRFYSEIDQNAFSYGWISDDSTKKGVSYRQMRFDYENHKMYYEWGKKLSPDVRQSLGMDTIAIDTISQDGLSLFFYAREHVHQKKTDAIITFIDTNQAKTEINFLNEESEVEIDAVDYPVDVVKLDGHADFIGIFGLTGGFEGWFSNDGARIPIKARLKVIVGSIRVELSKWNRGNWVPQKAIVKN